MKLEIQSQDHTNIYSASTGHVVIEQISSGRDNCLVFIAIQNVDIICKMLQEKKHQATERRITFLEKQNSYLISKAKQ
jgi:hypothetical protein